MTTNPPAPNPHLGAVPAYQPGRSAEALMREHGLHHAVKLASNECPFGPLPGVADAVAHAVAGINRYADHSASAVAALFATTVGVERDHVAVGPGTVGLLEQLALAYTGPGAEVLFPWPSFIAYPQFSHLTGATPVTVPLTRQSFDVDAVLGAVTPRTRLVLLANPNNPTSTGLRTADLRRLVEGIPERCLVVVDEAYREFVTGADMPDGLALFGDRPNVAVLRTLSKAYSLAGLRVGFMVAHPDVVRAVDAALIPFAVNALAQAAALVALRAGDEVADRCAVITGERDRTTRALRERGLGVADSQANFLWLPARSRTDEMVHALERQGVATRGLGSGIRVTVSVAPENKRFLHALDHVLDQHPGITDDWGLPTGDRARAVTRWVDRLDAVVRRLRTHAGARHDGTTRPTAGHDERWDAGQVWAHLGEISGYWLGELRHLLAVGSAAPVPFGRAPDDAARREAIERDRGVDPRRLFGRVDRAADRLRALLAEMSEADWSRLGDHPVLHHLSVDQVLDRVLIGHLEEHAAQLDELLVRG